MNTSGPKSRKPLKYMVWKYYKNPAMFLWCCSGSPVIIVMFSPSLAVLFMLLLIAGPLLRTTIEISARSLCQVSENLLFCFSLSFFRTVHQSGCTWNSNNSNIYTNFLCLSFFIAAVSSFSERLILLQLQMLGTTKSVGNHRSEND